MDLEFENAGDPTVDHVGGMYNYSSSDSPSHFGGYSTPSTGNHTILNPVERTLHSIQQLPHAQVI